MTIEQAIEQYDGYANVCMCHNLTVSQKEFEQLAEWLRELQERRKGLGIVRCGECKYLRRWISTNHQFCDITACKVSEDEFCNRAERRTE